MILAWVVALIAPLFVVGALTEAVLHYLFGWSVYPFTWLLETSPVWLRRVAVSVGGSGLVVGLVMAFAPRLASARAFGVLDSRTNRAIVVFCGSEKKDNFTINALVWPYYGPMRHMGFHRAWYHIRPEIRQWLKDVVGERQATEVVFAGHSLGGALAQVAAFDLAGELPISHVVSLGSACIGGPGMRDRFAECETAGGGKLNARHFTYTLDMMPRIPPSSIFRQVGKRFRLPEHGGPVEGTEGSLFPSSWIFFLETISIVASLFLGLLTKIRGVVAKIFRWQPAKRDRDLSATGLNEQGKVNLREAWNYFVKLAIVLPWAVPSVLLVVGIAILIFPFVVFARVYVYTVVKFYTGLAVQHAAGNYRDAFKNYADSFGS
jgi:pimeloyl-ACP methyl ester carboxylesterase